MCVSKKLLSTTLMNFGNASKNTKKKKEYGTQSLYVIFSKARAVGRRRATRQHFFQFLSNPSAVRAAAPQKEEKKCIPADFHTRSITIQSTRGRAHKATHANGRGGKKAKHDRNDRHVRRGSVRARMYIGAKKE